MCWKLGDAAIWGSPFPFSNLILILTGFHFIFVLQTDNSPFSFPFYFICLAFVCFPFHFSLFLFNFFFAYLLLIPYLSFLSFFFCLFRCLHGLLLSLFSSTPFPLLSPFSSCSFLVCLIDIYFVPSQ